MKRLSKKKWYNILEIYIPSRHRKLKRKELKRVSKGITTNIKKDL